MDKILTLDQISELLEQRLAALTNLGKWSLVREGEHCRILVGAWEKTQRKIDAIERELKLARRSGNAARLEYWESQKELETELLEKSAEEANNYFWDFDKTYQAAVLKRA